MKIKITPWNTKINDNKSTYNLPYFSILIQLVYIWPICFTFVRSTPPSALAHKVIISAIILHKYIKVILPDYEI